VVKANKGRSRNSKPMELLPRAGQGANAPNPKEVRKGEEQLTGYVRAAPKHEGKGKKNTGVKNKKECRRGGGKEVSPPKRRKGAWKDSNALEQKKTP